MISMRWSMPKGGILFGVSGAADGVDLGEVYLGGLLDQTIPSSLGRRSRS